MSNYLTPGEIIKTNLTTVVSASPELLKLQHDRAHGALACLVNLGLIDSDTFHAAGRDLHATYEARRQTEPRA